MRLGEYEFLPYNKWCWQLYKVMPEGWTGKGKHRRADDGRVLIALDCYPNDIPGCIRRVIDFTEKDGGDTASVREVEGRMEALYGEMRELAASFPRKAVS